MNNNCALILIDIQNDYFDGGANPLTGSLEASLKARKLLDYSRQKKMHIIYIQHISNYPTATFFRPDTDGAKIHDNIKPLPSEKIIIKHYPNSFRETDLLSYLRSITVNDLIICGMMTHMCVDATVRAAKDYGFNITLISDACATRELELNGNNVPARYVHDAFLSALDSYYASIKNTEDFIKTEND